MRQPPCHRLGDRHLTSTSWRATRSSIVRFHHERWDGDGYPDGSRRRDIPLAARIFAVADTLDAITSDRPYRAGASIDDRARGDRREAPGAQFDPEAVEALMAVPDDVLEHIRTETRAHFHSLALKGLPRASARTSGTGSRTCCRVWRRCTERGVTVLAASSVYETAPQGEMLDQPDFLNAAIEIDTELGPEELLDVCKDVERELGREPGRTAPLAAARSTSTCCCSATSSYTSDRLTLPHAEVTSRRFVLEPLLELDPDLRSPGASGSPTPAAADGPARAAKRRPLSTAAIISGDAARGRRRQHPDPHRDVQRRLARGALALRHRARVDGDELATVLVGLLELRDLAFEGHRRRDRLVGGPTARPRVRGVSERYLGGVVKIVGPGLKSGIPIRTENPHEVGADRLVNAVAAYDHVESACIVVDFGTAITYDVVSAEGELLGAIISPGVEISMEALSASGRPAAQGRAGAAQGADRPQHAGVDPVGRDLRLRGPGGRHRVASAPGAGSGGHHDRHRRARDLDRAVLRGDRRGRRPAHAHRPAPALGANRE